MKSEVPEGWVSRKLSTITQNKKFAIVDGPFGTQLHADEYVDEGVPVIRVINLSFEGKFIDKNLVHVTENKSIELKRSQVNPEDIIIAKTGATIGKSGMFPDKYEKGIIASSCLKLSVDKNRANSQFILYKICSESGQKQILDGASGSTRTTINITPFSQLEFLVPKDLKEQEKIANILQTIDKNIDNTKSLIAKHQKMKLGLMQDLFKDGDWVKATAGDLLKKGVLAEIQDGNHGEQHPKSVDFVDEGVPFVMANDIVDAKIQFDDCHKITKRQYDGLRIGFSKPSDVLLTHKGTVGRTCIVPNNCKELMLTPQVTYYRIKNQNRLSSKYLYHYFNSDYFQTQILAMSAQSTRNYVGIIAQRKLLIKYPDDVNEQKRIVEILESIDHKLEYSKNNLNKLLKMKSGLMQDLLTGKVRVAA